MWGFSKASHGKTSKTGALSKTTTTTKYIWQPCSKSWKSRFNIQQNNQQSLTGLIIAFVNVFFIISLIQRRKTFTNTEFIVNWDLYTYYLLSRMYKNYFTTNFDIWESYLYSDISAFVSLFYSCANQTVITRYFNRAYCNSGCTRHISIKICLLVNIKHRYSLFRRRLVPANS